MSYSTELNMVLQQYRDHIGETESETMGILEAVFNLLNNSKIEAGFQMSKYIEMIGKRKQAYRNLNELLKAIENWLHISDYSDIEEQLHIMRIQATCKVA